MAHLEAVELDDVLAAELARRAEASGRSVAAEHAALLRNVLGAGMDHRDAIDMDIGTGEKWAAALGESRAQLAAGDVVDGGQVRDRLLGSIGISARWAAALEESRAQLAAGQVIDGDQVRGRLRDFVEKSAPWPARGNPGEDAAADAGDDTGADMDPIYDYGARQARALLAQARLGGIEFRAFLPGGSAEWILGLVADGKFSSPADAVFELLREAEDFEKHGADLRQILEIRTFYAAVDDQRPGIPHAEVMAGLRKKIGDPRPVAASWVDWRDDAPERGGIPD